MTTKTFLLSDVGSDAIGQTKTFVSLEDNARPVGSFTLQVYTTYNKARDPQGRQVKLTLTIPTKDKLKDLALWLVQAASSDQPVQTLGELLGESLSDKDVRIND